MEAGIPFALLTLLSSQILLLWAKNGVGKRSVRYTVAALMLGTLGASWALVLSFGAFNDVGQLGLVVGFLVAATAFLVPPLHKRWATDDIDS